MSVTIWVVILRTYFVTKKYLLFYHPRIVVMGSLLTAIFMNDNLGYLFVSIEQEDYLPRIFTNFFCSMNHISRKHICKIKTIVIPKFLSNVIAIFSHKLFLIFEKRTCHFSSYLFISFSKLFCIK